MKRRLSFNEDVYNYDKFRPTYPDDLFKAIVSYSKINANSKPLEIGIGTGQATTPFLEMGCNVTAVELGDRLSAFVQKKYAAYPKFRVINADFALVPLERDSFDLIYSATAFHWLPVPESYQKVMACLKRGGTIALFWNHPFPNRQDDATNRASQSVYNKYRPSDKARREFSEQDCETRVRELEWCGFTDIQWKLFHRVRTLPTDAYISLINTYSDHRALESAIKVRFEENMRLALDAAGGKINIYDTIDLYLARKP